jgi:hypothetical protein
MLMCPRIDQHYQSPVKMSAEDMSYTLPEIIKKAKNYGLIKSKEK